MTKNGKIISIILGVALLTTVIVIIKKRKKGNQDNSGSDIVDPYIESEPIVNTKKYNVPFKNTDQGNAFRIWINRYYPKFAKTNSIDPTGSFNNSYIYKAWETYGNAYLKGYGYKIPENPKALGFKNADSNKGSSPFPNLKFPTLCL